MSAIGDLRRGAHKQGDQENANSLTSTPDTGGQWFQGDTIVTREITQGRFGIVCFGVSDRR